MSLRFSLLLLIGLLLRSAPLLAQHSGVSIPLDTFRSRPRAAMRLTAPQGNFYQRHRYQRIPLQHPANLPLRQTNRYPAARRSSGLVAHLIEGLRRDSIYALDPRDPRQAYRYPQLLWDLIDLQGLPDTGSIAPEQIQWENLEREIDLLRVYQFSRSSQQYDHIVYLGLIWRAGQQPGRRVLLAIVPFAPAVPWLDRLQCQWKRRDGRSTGTSATRFLQGQMYQGYQPDRRRPDFWLLPPDDRSARPIPDWFEQH